MLRFFLQRFRDSSSTLGSFSTYHLAALISPLIRDGELDTFLTQDFTATCDTTGKSHFIKVPQVTAQEANMHFKMD